MKKVSFVFLLHLLLLDQAGATDFTHSSASYLYKFQQATCGANDTAWGYGTPELEADLLRWSLHPDAQRDTLGFSGQGRPLHRLTVTGKTIAKQRQGALTAKPTVHIHARTHPREVQSSFVIREMIDFLLNNSLQTTALRLRYNFVFVPMYNPDGVARGCQRTTPGGVDLESAFFATPPPVEVAALRTSFDSLMLSAHPIRVALNLHSSVNLCSRFFFFHDAGGTSEKYAAMQQHYIASVAAFFPGGFQDWNYIVSWQNGDPGVYPESYFWSQFKESVLALTYEDSNCENASAFDSTARALLLGTDVYMQDPIAAVKPMLTANKHRAALPSPPPVLLNGRVLRTPRTATPAAVLRESKNKNSVLHIHSP